MSYEAPRAASYQSVLKLEAGAQRVFGRIKSSTVAFVAAGFEDAAEYLLQQVQLVGSQVVEISPTGNVGLYAPGQVLAVVVQVAGRLCKAYLDVNDVSDGSFFDQCFYFLEIRQVTAVVGDKAGDTCFVGDAVDAATFFVGDCHWLLNVDRLTCFHRHDGIGGM